MIYFIIISVLIVFFGLGTYELCKWLDNRQKRKEKQIEKQKQLEKKIIEKENIKNEIDKKDTLISNIVDPVERRRAVNDRLRDAIKNDIDTNR
jgi:hypothetical protein